MWTIGSCGDLPSASSTGGICEADLHFSDSHADEAAWGQLIQRFHPFIVAAVAGMASRWGRDASAATEDLIQETYLRLCAHGPAVWGHAPDRRAALGLMRAIAHGAVNDHFKALLARKRGGHQPPGNLTDALERTASPTGAPQIERAILLEEIDMWLRRLKSATRERDRAIFWLYYREGLTARAIADLPFQLTAKGIERLLARLTGQLRLDLAPAAGWRSLVWKRLPPA